MDIKQTASHYEWYSIHLHSHTHTHIPYTHVIT